MFNTCSTFCKSPKLLYIVATIGLIFGAATLFSGGRVLFGSEAVQQTYGNYMPFVVWFNFIAGFAYIAAAIGLYGQAPWAAWLARLIVLATVLVAVAFGINIYLGEAYEMRTVGALALRTSVWLVIACIARQVILKKTDTLSQ